MEMSLSPTGWAVWLLLAFAASAQALVHPVRRGTLRHQPAMAAEEESEESKEILGAAALGAISAIAVTDEVGMGISHFLLFLICHMTGISSVHIVELISEP